MNTLAKTESAALALMSEGEMLNVLRNSLYPGAQDASIKLVLGYCKAAGLDPMQKPVHIVPMWDSKSGQMRDIIMPGVGSYRTQAARSGEYAGVTDPEFGPDITEKIGGQEITYPTWCRVTVKRLLSNGSMAEFSATERWKENYAVKGGKDKSVAPNAMWTKRPYAQLAKCAEAQALRKAFPECGSAPTADEMEGKTLDADATVIDGNTGEILNTKPQAGPKALPLYPAEQFEKSLEGFKNAIAAGRNTAEQIIARIGSKYRLTPEQADRICDLETVPAPHAAGPIDDFVAAMEAAEQGAV